MILTADDGSKTLFSERFQQTYHSLEGAVMESKYVYIDNGLSYISKGNIVKIVEFGFGTGLNAILTLEEGLKLGNVSILYESLEKYPLTKEVYESLSYQSISPFAAAIQLAEWEKEVPIVPNFTLIKRECDFLEFLPKEDIDLVYFDPFSPDSQPELWSEAQFAKIFLSMRQGGVLVTYSAKGVVKQRLRNVGFEVQRLKGAGKKRHMVRAIKI
jgi:tRNA U34 5-methylaminomethyl-2-thiouridine-forming methyltransferase MnmC